MKEAELYIKNNITVTAESTGVKSDDDAKGDGSQYARRSPSGRRRTLASGIYSNDYSHS